MRRTAIPLLAACALLLAGGPSRAEEATEAVASTPRLVTTAEMRGHRGIVRTLAFAPDGLTLATGGPDRTTRIWDVAKATEIARNTLPRGG